MMKKQHMYGTDIVEPTTQEEVIKTIDRTLRWTLKTLGIEHLVTFAIEPSERPGVCKTFILTLTEETDGNPN